MHVILLERIARLGQMGDVVNVRNGYARNFLLPQGKALRSTEANRKRFESEKTQLEARNLERRGEAEEAAKKLEGQTFVIVRQAGETGQLYGSVSTRDMAETMDGSGFKIGRSQIQLNQPIKRIGLHNVAISLHAEVETSVVINVARSEDEAARQARGEDLTGAAMDDVEEVAEGDVSAEDSDSEEAVGEEIAAEESDEEASESEVAPTEA